MAICCLDRFGSVHLERNFLWCCGPGWKFTLASQRFGYVVDEKHSLGTGTYRHECLLPRERDPWCQITCEVRDWIGTN